MSDNLDQLTEQVATGLAQASPARTTPELYRPLLHLLARGEPVDIPELARAAGRPVAEVHSALAEWPDTECDEAGRIVGYGITLVPTSHRFTVAGRQLYTWCALDTLIFPAILGLPAEVESPCHTTGTPVRVTVDPDVGITSVEPRSAMVSLVAPDPASTSVREAFCHQVHFFTSADTADTWLAAHPGASALPVDDAYRLGRPLIEAVLAGGPPPTC